MNIVIGVLWGYGIYFVAGSVVALLWLVGEMMEERRKEYETLGN